MHNNMNNSRVDQMRMEARVYALYRSQILMVVQSYMLPSVNTLFYFVQKPGGYSAVMKAKRYIRSKTEETDQALSVIALFRYTMKLS